MLTATRQGQSSQWCAPMRMDEVRKKVGYALKDTNQWDGTLERLLPHAYLALRRYVRVVKIGDLSPFYFLETLSFVYKVVEYENRA